MPAKPPAYSRRRILRLGLSVGVAGLAGCSETESATTTSTRSTGTATDAGQTRAGPGTTTDRQTDSTTRGGQSAETEIGETADSTQTAGPTQTATPTQTTGTPIHASYDTTAVRVTTPDGTVLGSVTAAIADTPDLRYLGLSDTESLPEDRGMLFVYDRVSERTFVMREMDFGLDIVYADDEGVITRIHHAPEPGPGEDGNEQEYPGRGQYVLELNIGWTTERGVETGDLLEFEL